MKKSMTAKGQAKVLVGILIAIILLVVFVTKVIPAIIKGQNTVGDEAFCKASLFDPNTANFRVLGNLNFQEYLEDGDCPCDYAEKKVNHSNSNIVFGAKIQLQDNTKYADCAIDKDPYAYACFLSVPDEKKGRECFVLFTEKEYKKEDHCGSPFVSSAYERNGEKGINKDLMEKQELGSDVLRQFCIVDKKTCEKLLKDKCKVK